MKQEGGKRWLSWEVWAKRRGARTVFNYFVALFEVLGVVCCPNRNIKIRLWKEPRSPYSLYYWTPCNTVIFILHNKEGENFVMHKLCVRYHVMTIPMFIMLLTAQTENCILKLLFLAVGFLPKTKINYFRYWGEEIPRKLEILTSTNK